MPSLVARTGAPLLGGPLPVELMNTVWADRDGVHDALGDTAAVRAWLVAVDDRLGLGFDGSGRAGSRAGAARLRHLRDALRRLAAEATGDVRPPVGSEIAARSEAVAVVNECSALAPTWSTLTWPPDGRPGRAVRSEHPRTELAVSRLAEQAVALFSGPDLGRLQACEAPGCVLYFLRDHPRREWCSAACGNRARVARHYRRHHGDEPV